MEGITMRYYLSFRNEVGDFEDLEHEFNDLRKATAEARDLQRILSKDKKEARCYYAVFETRPELDKDLLVYKANGY
jgi:hypothetical protein